jgi:hypothetical protein
MFKFLKRLAMPEPKPKPAPKRKASKKSRLPGEIATEPSALPQVTEGNDHSDWALWEDSVAALDSQMNSVNSSFGRSQHEADEVSEFQAFDAFDRVNRKDPRA